MGKDFFKTILIFKMFLNNLSGRIIREWVSDMFSKGMSTKDIIKEYERVIMLMEVKISFMKNVRDELIRDGFINNQSVPEDNELLTIQQVMSILHIKSKTTLQNYEKTGMLKPVKISSGIGKSERGKTLYRKKDVDKFISER